MTRERVTERFVNEEIDDAWAAEAMQAWGRYLDTHPEVDPIAAERVRSVYLDGFIAASKVPPKSEIALTQCVPLDPQGIIVLSRRLMPYIMAFGRHGSIWPGDMMAAMLICLTTIGRQLHPTLTNRQVFDVFTAESGIILQVLDKIQSSQDEVKH